MVTETRLERNKRLAAIGIINCQYGKFGNARETIIPRKVAAQIMQALGRFNACNHPERAAMVENLKWEEMI